MLKTHFSHFKCMWVKRKEAVFRIISKHALPFHGYFKIETRYYTQLHHQESDIISLKILESQLRDNWLGLPTDLKHKPPWLTNNCLQRIQFDLRGQPAIVRRLLWKSWKLQVESKVLIHYLRLSKCYRAPNLRIKPRVALKKAASQHC